jgi:hypothetical protein
MAPKSTSKLLKPISHAILRKIMTNNITDAHFSRMKIRDLTFLTGQLGRGREPISLVGVQNVRMKHIQFAMALTPRRLLH